jgi:hypothetical protein
VAVQRSAGANPGPSIYASASAAFSPDGKHIVIGFRHTSRNKYEGPMWKMWDTATGKEVQTYWQNIDYDKRYPDVDFISYLPDGKGVLTVDEQGMCQIWDAKKDKVLREFKIGEPHAFRCALSADGSRLLTVRISEVQLWNLNAAKSIAQPEVGDYNIRTVAIWPDGKWAVFRYTTPTQGQRTYSFLYDFEKKKRTDFAIPNKNTESATLHPFLISPDGKAVIAHKYHRENAGVVLCDAATLREQKQIRPLLPRDEVSLAVLAGFTPDSQILFMLDNAYKNRNYGWKLRCRDMKSNEDFWLKSDEREIVEPRLMVPSPNGDTVLLVPKGLYASGLFGLKSVLLSTKTGEVKLQLDSNVFPDGPLLRPDQKDRK